MPYNGNPPTYRKEEPMWNKICEWFARRYIPEDHQHELAEALFNWKYKS